MNSSFLWVLGIIVATTLILQSSYFFKKGEGDQMVSTV